jgi:hypothetical protein
MFRDIIAVIARIIHIQTPVKVVCSAVLTYLYVDRRLLWAGHLVRMNKEKE